MAWRAPFVLELVPERKDLDFDLALAVVLQQPLVRLPLLVSQAVQVPRVRRAEVARLLKGQVALHVAGRPAAARRREADVIGHVRCLAETVDDEWEGGR